MNTETKTKKTVPLKAWKIAKAQELGTTVKAIEMRLFRGQIPMPKTVSRRGTQVEVEA